MKICNYRIVTFASIFLLLGVFVGNLIIQNIIVTIVLPLVFLTSGIIFSIISKRWVYFAVFLALAIGISIAAIDRTQFSATRINKAETNISGRVCEKRQNGKIVLENLEVDGKEVSGKAILHCDFQYGIGTEYKAKCSIRTYKNDIFDFASCALYNDRIYYELQKIEDEYTIAGEKTFVEKIKYKAENAMGMYMSKENFGIMKSLLFGDKSNLNFQDRQAINGVGLAHVFAVSGLHIGFLAGAFLWLLKKLHIPRTGAFLLVLALLTVYGGVTGFPAGVKRATIMFAVSTLAKIIALKNDMLNSLSLSAALIILTNPRELFDLGFLMSFGAVLGITCFYKPLYKVFASKIHNKFFKYLIGILCTTLAANIFIIPILFNVFGCLSMYAPLANIIILPILSIVFPFSAIVSIFSLIWVRFGVFYIISEYALQAIRLISQGLYNLPGACLAVSSMGVLTFVYLAGFIVLSPYIIIKKEYKYSMVALFGVTTLIFSFV